MNAHDGDAPVSGDDHRDEVSALDDPARDEVIELLSGYLDRGEAPPAELLQSSPENQLALAALQRVREAAGLLVDVDADGGGAPEGWVEGILGNLTREVRAGRSIPLSHPSPRASLSLTEGAVRGLVRAVGDQIDGILVGRCVLDGDVTVPGSPVVVKVEASVFWGEPIPESAERLRAAIAGALLQHTELSVEAVDVTITDVHLRRDPGLPGGAPVTGNGE
ncbi:Asp23/Gls24 family envelope stress response protein [Herbiconiux sp. A18JL235]|uniref:Asp23/Gls24 family envelope stress response protein n=1 Tax=Herbiconiux sp. A18JL235 TaxID=3152363 RepID=A0AB39BIF1_9MICO